MSVDDVAANAGEGQQGRQRLDLEYAVVRLDAREVLEGDEGMPTEFRSDHISAVVGDCVVAGERQAVSEDIPELRRRCKRPGQNQREIRFIRPLWGGEADLRRESRMGNPTQG